MTQTTANSRYAVVAGLGRTGVSVVRHLREKGWRVAVTDTRERPPGLDDVLAIERATGAVALSLGRLDERLLDGASCVVASPGLALDGPFFARARAQRIEIVGDVELFAREAPARVVGITGTNGKSTVTTLVGRMAERAGIRVRVGGNLGEPALELLDAPATTQLYVLELSSYQLDTTDSLELAAATVLNVSPDHLDRYADVDAYAASKRRIFARCGTAVVNLDDPCVARMPCAGQRTLGFTLRADATADYAVVERDAVTAAPRGPWLARRGEPLLPVAAMKIAGLHNAANALAALALGEAIDLPMPAMLAELASFPGLPHRTQWIADLRGVRYVDDSKGTNVGATIAAVQGLAGPLVIIAGGDGKGQDFAPLAEAFRGKVRATVLIGRDAPALAAVLAGVCAVERCATLEEAVEVAARAAQSGDTVLLSPACASLDMFRDYAHRGAVFADAVRGLAA